MEKRRSWVPGFQTAWLKPAKGSLGALEDIRVNVLQKQCTPSIPRLPLHPHQSKDRKRWVLGEHSTHSPPERQHLQSRTRLHWGFLKGSFLVLITSWRLINFLKICFESKDVILKWAINMEVRGVQQSPFLCIIYSARLCPKQKVKHWGTS